MIQIRKLEFCYPEGAFCLRIDDLNVPRGETLAVIGPSGTGKTTLLNLIAGVVTPQAGQITTGGVEVSSLGDDARRRFRIQHVGFVFQEFELMEHLSVLDNILLPFRIHPALTLSGSIRERAHDLADEVSVADKLNRNVVHLSQGERQRVAVCRALLSEPGLLLADEPTGNLDPANKEHVLDIIFDQARKHDSTLVVVTHDHSVLDRFDRTLDFSSFV